MKSNQLIIYLFFSFITFQIQAQVLSIVDLNLENTFRSERYPNEFNILNSCNHKQQYYKIANMVLQDSQRIVLQKHIEILESYISIYNVEAIELYVEALYRNNNLNSLIERIRDGFGSPLKNLLLAYAYRKNNEIARSLYYFEKVFKSTKNVGEKAFLDFKELKSSK